MLMTIFIVISVAALALSVWFAIKGYLEGDNRSVVCGLLAVALFVMGCVCSSMRHQREAVKAGHAEWFLDSIGEVKFRWKEAK